MTGRRPPPRRSSEYAWLLTTPMAVLAAICVVVYWVREPDWAGAWPGGIAALVAAAAANVAVLNVVIRRQTFFIPVTEIPLVLALFFLPSVTTILAITVAA